MQTVVDDMAIPSVETLEPKFLGGQRVLSLSSLPSKDRRRRRSAEKRVSEAAIGGLLSEAPEWSHEKRFKNRGEGKAKVQCVTVLQFTDVHRSESIQNINGTYCYL